MPLQDDDSIQQEQQPEAADAAASRTQEASVQLYSSPLPGAQTPSWVIPDEVSVQFPMHIPPSFQFTSIPDPLQLQPSAYLTHPDNFNAAELIGTEISELSPADLRNCFVEAQHLPQLEDGPEANDQGHDANQVEVIQPQVQHVVYRFLAKMRSLVARRRMERGEISSLSSEMDQRLRLRACVSTFQIAKCECSCLVLTLCGRVCLMNQGVQDTRWVCCLGFAAAAADEH